MFTELFGSGISVPEADVALLFKLTYLTHKKALREWRLECQLSRMGWAATTLLLTLLAGTTLAQDRPENLLPETAQPLSAVQQTEVIEKARAIALEYTDNLPNFIATQTVRRQALPKGSKSWKDEDTLTLDVAFVEGDERYTLLAINGKPTKKTKDKVGGLKFDGEFGSFLLSIFEPSVQTNFKWERWSDLRGRPTHVFSYHIEKDRSGYALDFDGRHKGSVAVSGLVFVDRETHQVMRFTSTADLPTNWPATDVFGELDYGFVNVDGRQFLLPLHAEMTLLWKNGRQGRSVTEFSNYHKFSTGVTIAPVTHNDE